MSDRWDAANLPAGRLLACFSWTGLAVAVFLVSQRSGGWLIVVVGFVAACCLLGCAIGAAFGRTIQGGAGGLGAGLAAMLLGLPIALILGVAVAVWGVMRCRRTR